MFSLEYAAGFFDGEGTVLIERAKETDRNSPRHTLQVIVVNAHKPVIDAFAEKFGGSVNKVIKKQSYYKQVWRWRLSGKNCIPFLEAIRPYLKQKATEAWLALEFMAQRWPHWNNKHKGDARKRIPLEELALRDGFYWALRNAKWAI